MTRGKVFDRGEKISAIVTNPVAVVAGNPCRIGLLTGVCTVSKSTGGNPTDYSSVDAGPAVWDLSVIAVGAIAIGDLVYYHDGAPGVLNNTAAGGFLFGYALEIVGAGLTATVRVLHVVH